MNSPLWDQLLVDCRLATPSEPNRHEPTRLGALGWRDGKLAFVGPMNELPGKPADLAREVHSSEGRLVTPGLIDCHTHLVFGGNRAGEFEQRLEGASYEEISRAGGGIRSTVRATREASLEELIGSALPRARDLVASGVTTLEIKSGYGLDLTSERRMLQAARRIGEILRVDVRTSFLGLHAVPPEYANDRAGYLELVCEELLPTLHGEGLVDAVDGFCEGIAFSREEVRRLFDKARELGLPVKLHAEQLSDLGGASLVAEFGGLSADHLEYADESGVAAMAAAGTVAVLLPGAWYALRETKLPPVDAMRKHGVPMAVATDLNPGTSPLRSLPLAMNMACTLFRLTPSEALRGATAHAAQALGLDDRGVLTVGKRADLVVWDCHQAAELAYWIGGNLVHNMYCGGTRLA